MCRAVNPTVSVVIPLHNAAGTIAAAISSIGAAGVGDWEAIVIDDGSRDAGPEIVAGLARREPRVTLHRQANTGPSAARNRGLEMARGRYIAFLDADDWFAPGGLAALIASAESSGLGAACGGFEFRDAAGRALRAFAGPESASIGLDEHLAGAPILIHSHVLRRDALGGERFDAALSWGEDTDLWLRLATRGVRWACVRPVVAAYRMHAGSLSKRAEAAAAQARRVMQTGFDRAMAAGWAERGIDLSDGRRRRVLADLALGYATRLALIDDASNGEAARSAAGSSNTSSVGAASRPRATNDRAIAVLRSNAGATADPAPGAGGRATVTPGSAAAAAFWGLFLGRCTGPTADRAWLHGLREWWRRCVAEGFAEPGLPEEASIALMWLIDGPERVADALLDCCGGARLVRLIGLGRNGQVIVARAAARGVRLIVRDDRLDAGALPPGLLPVGAIAEAMSAPLDETPTIVSPMDDRGIVERLGRCGGGAAGWKPAPPWTEAAAGSAAPVGRWCVEQRRLESLWRAELGKPAGDDTLRRIETAAHAGASAA